MKARRVTTDLVNMKQGRGILHNRVVGLFVEDVYTIEILGWKKFNPRGDIENASWFRLKNSFAVDPEFDHLSGEEKWVFVYLLSLASLKCRPLIAVSDKNISTRAHVSLISVQQSIQKLIAKNTLRRRDGDVTSTYRRRTLDREEKKEKKEKSTNTNPLVNLWNEYRGGLREVKGCTGRRKTAADARWKENPSPEYWIEIIKKIAASPFCRGEKNKPGPHERWKADFDFLIVPDTQHKVLEGKYDDHSRAPTSPLKTMADIEAGNV